MGATPEQAREWVGAAGETAPAIFEVWQENWETVEVFQALDTQWRIVGGLAGSRVRGIDYVAIPATLALLGVKKRDRKRVFKGLRIMERGVLDTSYPSGAEK